MVNYRVANRTKPSLKPQTKTGKFPWVCTALQGCADQRLLWLLIADKSVTEILKAFPKKRNYKCCLA